MKKYLKQKLLSYLTRHLLNGITDSELILTHELKKNPRLQNKELVGKYKDQAELILSTDLWTELVKEFQLVAQQRMFYSSQTFDDMLWGKYVLLIVETMQKKLRKIASISVVDASSLNQETALSGTAYAMDGNTLPKKLTKS